jgi:5-methylcytosine-specific restriction protein B
MSTTVPIRYSDAQVAVYKALLQRHDADPGFTFSVRRGGFKDNKKGLFIGTNTSYWYFSFTLWGIPVSDGSATGDLLDYTVGWNRDGSLRTYLHYQLATTATGDQNLANLAFGQALKQQPIAWDTSADNATVLRLTYTSATSLTTLDQVGTALLALIDETSPLVDAAVAATHATHPGWVAGRIAVDEFKTRRARMEAKREQWLQGNASDTESKPSVTIDIVAPDSTGQQLAKFPLNQILYGPPGTGKTYHTIARAVALLDGITDEEVAKQYPPQRRKELRQRFEDFRQAQRVDFITFHQAFSYEDFVEGIKPLPPAKESLDGAPAAESKPVQYDVVPGVFRRICESAAAAANPAAAPPLPDFDTLYDEFVAGLHERITSTKGSLTFYSLTNLPVTLTNVNLQLPTKRLTFLHANSAQQDHHIDKQWIKKLYEKYTAIDQIKHLGNDITKAVGGSNATLMWVVFNELKKYEAAWIAQERAKQQTTPAPSFVLIIDEINRGNIANIFGELITLLEDDKRAGGTEALTVTLPYSKEKFTVPRNLYVLGTMNTADRSVEALDTALRRRFSFTEMLPQPELLSPHQMIARLWLKYAHEPWDGKHYKPAETALYQLLGCQELATTDQEPLWKKVREDGADPDTTIKIFDGVQMTGVDLEKMLRAINDRLEQLLDHDHCIGHALLIHVEDLPGLQEAFRRSILPLLQEYFFGDWGKIGLVLGAAFIGQVNKKASNTGYKLLPFSPYSTNELSEKPVYRLADVRLLPIKAFQDIYAA